MADLNVHFNVNVRITPRIARWSITALCLALMTIDVSPEDVKLTTYYPAPSGVYTNMVTTQQTVLARDSGNVGIGTAVPAQKLDVGGNANFAGTVGIGNFPAPPSPASDGEIYYDTTQQNFYGFKNGSWQPLGGAFSNPTAYSCGWASGGTTDKNMGTAQLCVMSAVDVHTDGTGCDGAPYCSTCQIFQPHQSGNPYGANWDLHCANIGGQGNDAGCTALCLGNIPPPPLKAKGGSCNPGKCPPGLFCFKHVCM